VWVTYLELDDLLLQLLDALVVVDERGALGPASL
jgi:hypothetical protein